MSDQFQRGDQVVYVPNHAGKDMSHPDVEYGFVTSLNSAGDAFVRYWRNGQLGTLRTVANSECTPIDNLYSYNSVPQRTVAAALRKIEEDK